MFLDSRRTRHVLANCHHHSPCLHRFCHRAAWYGTLALFTTWKVDHCTVSPRKAGEIQLSPECDQVISKFQNYQSALLFACLLMK